MLNRPSTLLEVVTKKCPLKDQWSVKMTKLFAEGHVALHLSIKIALQGTDRLSANFVWAPTSTSAHQSTQGDCGPGAWLAS